MKKEMKLTRISIIILCLFCSVKICMHFSLFRHSVEVHETSMFEEINAKVITESQLEYSCQRKWPHLELFLPSDYKHYLGEFSTFINSFLAFWPHYAANILLVVDSETIQLSKMAEDFKLKTKLINNSRVALNDPLTYYARSRKKGHDRQQLLMFWADNFTSAEYVGFLDTDTLFTSVVDVSDLFLEGKARIIGIYDKEHKFSFWNAASTATKWFIGKDELIKGMSYFPVIVKTRHLKELRSHVVRIHGKEPFNDLFSRWLDKPYSQFNIICNYLWYFHRDEYHWHIQETSNASRWQHIPNRVPNPHLAEGTTWEMFQPFPRIALHINNRNNVWQKKVADESVCFALHDYNEELLGKFNPRCAEIIKRRSFNSWLFDSYEADGATWLWHPNVTKAARERRVRLKKSRCLPKLKESLLRNL